MLFEIGVLAVMISRMIEVEIKDNKVKIEIEKIG